MSELSRRSFLSRAGKFSMAAGAFAAVEMITRPKSAKAVPPSEKIRLGLVGIRGRGYNVGMGFAVRPDVEIAYLADVDTSLFDGLPSQGYMESVDPDLRGPRAAGFAKANGHTPKLVQDFRTVLDDKTVDAIVVATPDHWHALATVWGCQAGKHVYVEKPCSHNPWEGRQMVNAARKYDRVVQHGTQSRSAPYTIAAKKYIDDGKLGQITMVRVYNQKSWGNVKAVPDSAAPSHLDWNMWNGPAPEHAYNFNLWEHWNNLWNYSGGDIINDSIHQIDLARWLVGVDLPKSVYSTGGRWVEDGILECPDTQVAVYEYDKMLMTFEQTLSTPYMLKADAELRNSDMFPHWPQNAERIEIYGTKAYMVLGRHGGGWQVFGRTVNREPRPIDQMYGRWPDPEHQDNFLKCIREGGRPNADIEEGHRSVLLSQLANISYRLGGEKLVIDAEKERFTNSEAGNKLLKREYRAPWIVPDEV